MYVRSRHAVGVRLAGHQPLGVVGHRGCVAQGIRNADGVSRIIAPVGGGILVGVDRLDQVVALPDELRRRRRGGAAAHRLAGLVPGRVVGSRRRLAAVRLRQHVARRVVRCRLRLQHVTVPNWVAAAPGRHTGNEKCTMSPYLFRLAPTGKPTSLLPPRRLFLARVVR